MKDIINMMFAFSENAEAFREPINECIKALESYGPEAYGLMEKLIKAQSKLKMVAVKEYEEKGFTREEAIILACDQFSSAIKSFKNRG